MVAVEGEHCADVHGATGFLLPAPFRNPLPSVVLRKAKERERGERREHHRRSSAESRINFTGICLSYRLITC
jgi:hypothetical protein